MQHQRLNNNQYILTSLQKFGILNYIALTTPEFEATYKGQAHNIFPQIFRIRIYKYYVIFVLIFPTSCFFDQQGICFLFQLRNIGEKFCRFVFVKFVKTYSELDKRYDHGSEKTLFSKLDQSFTLHMEQKYR